MRPHRILTKITQHLDAHIEIDYYVLQGIENYKLQEVCWNQYIPTQREMEMSQLLRQKMALEKLRF